VRRDAIGGRRAVPVDHAAGEERRARSHSARDDSAFRKLERLAPKLLNEMSTDLRRRPAAREFAAIWRRRSYNFRSQLLFYYYEDHEGLDDQLQVIENLGLIHNAAINDVKWYRISEELADYLISRRAAAAVTAEWQWDDKVGVCLDPASDQRYCATCKADGESSPLKTEEHGYQCNVCGQYTSDPTRPRKEPSLPPPIRGPHGWMAN
jgi:hypothetical protein